jgi:hypothetical protein
MVFSFVLRTRCRGNIFLSIIIPETLSPGAKRSGREAGIQPELQTGEVVKSRQA